MWVPFPSVHFPTLKLCGIQDEETHPVFFFKGFFISSKELKEKKKATLQISKISKLIVALGMFLLILVCCHSV